MPYWARKKDETHTACVGAFLACGWSVLDISRAPKCVDLVVAKAGQVILVEVKTPRKQPTAGQLALMASWQGRVAVVSSVDDVIALSKRVV